MHFFTSHNYHFVVVVVIVWTFKIYFHSNFQVYITALLTIVTMLYIRPLELTHLISENLCSLTSISPFSPLLALVTINLSVSEFSVHKRYLRYVTKNWAQGTVTKPLHWKSHLIQTKLWMGKCRFTFSIFRMYLVQNFY